MARASVYTWLPLDEWAKIMGYSRWEFNGIAAFPEQIGSACSALWRQYPEQYDTVSREELAYAIKDAEDIISSYVNYNLLPDYQINEVVYPPRFYMPQYDSTVTARGVPKSVQVSKRLLRTLGIKAKTLLEAGATITRVDNDGDGFAETAQITVTSAYDQNQIRIYYPGESGADEWEIRPTTFPTSTTIEVPIWQIVKPEFIEGLFQDPLDGSDASIYLTTVDVYRVYTDTTDPVTLVFEPPYDCTTDCSQSSFDTCGVIRNEKLGFVVYNPTGSFDSVTGRVEPDKIELNYYSGWVGNQSLPLLNLDPFWKMPIAVLAASLLDRDPADCMGGQDDLPSVSQWRQDLALNNDQRSYAVTNFILENPFGITTRGAWFAYQRARRKKIV